MKYCVASISGAMRLVAFYATGNMQYEITAYCKFSTVSVSRTIIGATAGNAAGRFRLKEL
jgi:hypothetical protein